MEFFKFGEDFKKILPAVIAALLVLGAIFGYGLYKKWYGGEERPSYLPAPTGIAPLNPELAPEPTEIKPLKQSEIPKPTGVLPLGTTGIESQLEAESPPALSVPPPTGDVKPL
ncbi:MAG: hypothetical protein AAB527_03935 [Patescibacteria group bacterium]